MFAIDQAQPRAVSFEESVSRSRKRKIIWIFNCQFH
jgi:hypothetical protein